MGIIERINLIKLAKDCNPDDKVIVITAERYQEMLEIKANRTAAIDAEIAKTQEKLARLEEEKAELTK